MYPMEFDEKIKNIANQYREKAKNEKNTIFIGRLANYTYMNMDEVIKQCLTDISNRD
jgi:UDP-galactopyranose mutase